MDRLNAEDLLMLWPDELWPQEVGALAILDGGPLTGRDGHFMIERVRQLVGERLHLVPRFRQLLYTPRRGLGGPLWVDAPAFDIRAHVRIVPLPPPGDEATLLAAVEYLVHRRLDRSRPLWEMCLLPGLPGGRIGLFVKLHHAIADGIAAMATIGVFLDASPQTAAGHAPPWSPAAMPSAGDLLADNLRTRVARIGHAVSALARPAGAVRQVRSGWAAMRRPVTTEPVPVTSLNRVAGPDRDLALVRTSLDQVAKVAHAHGATVNDVLLAATAGGLRALLSGRGEQVDDLVLPVYVPVTLRPADQRGQARGNQISQLVVPIPVGEPGADRTLARIAAVSRERKAGSHPPLGALLRTRMARRAIVKITSRQPVNVTTADLPGPGQPRYLAGAKVLEVFPVLPLIANVPLGVGALSYAGQFDITLVADRDAVPDLGVFVAGLTHELSALGAGPAG